jgi:hypothetical protein
VALLLYAPLAAGVIEAMYVDWRFRALCRTAVTEITRPVIVEGFYDVQTRGDSWESSLRSGEGGYRFIEWTDRDGRVWRSERVGPGEVRRQPLQKPSARYHWRSPNVPSPYGHLMERREETIVDSETGEAIARRVTGYRHPAFIDGIWSQLMGAGPEICSSNDILHRTLIGIDRKEN